MKKTLALVLAFALVFSTFTTVFADETTTLSADAATCVSLGMLQGTNGTVDAAYTATTPTRLQAAVMFLRLKGLEATAKAFTGTDNFADVTNYAWAEGKNMMAYLKAHPELGWIGDNGNFNPAGLMTAQSYYKVLLESLGYKQNTAEVIGDFTYAGVIAFAAEKGLTKVAAVTNFTVNDLAVATVEALKANVKGGEKSLTVTLVEAGALDQAKAVAAGVYTAPVVALKAESVAATNLVEVNVTFNKAIDADTIDDGNFIFNGEDVVADNVSLSADGKVATISVDPMDNGENYDVEITGIADTTGVTIEDTVLTVTASDKEIPVAQSIELTGPNTFDITFSEPIDGTSDVSVDFADGVYDVTAVADGSTTVTATLGTDSLAEGDYDVVVTGAVDFAGYAAYKKTFTLKYVKDKTVPTPKIVSADQTEVVIDFGENVTDADGNTFDSAGAMGDAALDYFYHSYSGYNPDTVTADGSEVTLSFTTNPLPEGNVKVVVVYDANSSNIQDLWGNEMAESVALTATIKADSTKPEVTKVETDLVAGVTNVTLTFSEGLLEAPAIDEANYTILDADGEEVGFAIAANGYNADDYTVTLVCEDTLEGKYTVEVSGVTDDSVDENEIKDITLSFEVADETAPVLSDITAKGVNASGTTKSVIYVTFPEDMATTGLYSILNKDNYLFDGADLADADKVELFNGNKDQVKITIADLDTDVVDASLAFARLADASGNKTEDLSYEIAKIAGDTAPVVTSIDTLTTKTVMITVDQPLVSVPVTGFLVSKDGIMYEPFASISKVEVNSDNETEITATLKADEQFDDSADTALQVLVVEDKLKSETGSYMEPAAVTCADVDLKANAAVAPAPAVPYINGTTYDSLAGVYEAYASNVAVSDGIAPSTDSDDIIEGVVNGTIVIPFDEVLKSGNSYEALYANDIVVKNPDGDVLVAGVDYTTSLTNGNKDILVTLVAGETGKYKVYSKADITYIKDLAGNKANVFTDVVTLDAMKENVLPTATVAIGGTADDAITAHDTITITFSEATDKPVLTDASFTVANGHTLDLANGGSAVWNAAGTVLTITLGETPTLAAGDTISFAADNTVEDTVGNDFGDATFYTVPVLAGSAW